jgi:polyferredoxin
VASRIAGIFNTSSSIRILPRLGVSSTDYRATMVAGSIASQASFKLAVGDFWMSAINPFTAVGVVLATAATDAVYVMFTSAVVARRRIPAATWSSFWYLLSSFAVISYTENWIYVAFAAAGSWIGAFASITFLQRPPAASPPVGAAPH